MGELNSLITYMCNAATDLGARFQKDDEIGKFTFLRRNKKWEKLELAWRRSALFFYVGWESDGQFVNKISKL